MSFAKSAPKIAALHPEMRLGGFLAHDGTIEFYSRVKCLSLPSSVVVDLGAGRGAWFEDDESEFRKATRLMKGTVAHVMGLDVDPAVMSNKAIDSAGVIAENSPWPLEDGSVDIVVSDYVLEHVQSPELFAAQVFRVLKPGGWFCARTPTRFNYVALAARVVSNLAHARVLERVQPGRKAKDVFPTYYRLNSRSALDRAFGKDRFENFSYVYCSEPQYHFGNPLVYRAFGLMHRLLPASVTGNLFVFLQKRA